MNQQTRRPYAILFLCLGNICRSPTAEALFQAAVTAAGLEERFQIDSAGTASYHIGALPDQRMRHHAQKRGYDLSSPARQLTVADFHYFDAIVVMDDHNYRDAQVCIGDQPCRATLYKMADFLPNRSPRAIPDPYYGGAAGFEKVLDLLEVGTKNLLAAILNGRLSDHPPNFLPPHPDGERSE